MQIFKTRHKYLQEGNVNQTESIEKEKSSVFNSLVL